MYRKLAVLGVVVGLMFCAASQTRGEQAKGSFKQGAVKLRHAGALAFGPAGVLLVADAKAAAIYAIDTKDAASSAAVPVGIEAVDAKIAAALGIKAEDLLINDMAVNDRSHAIVLSVSRGRGPDADAVLIRIAPSGEITELALDNVSYSRAELPNAPEDKEVRRGKRVSNPRLESITDIEYRDGKVMVAGLSNEAFASTFRAIDYPFTGASKGAAVEIYHASHGGFETRSPIRTFTTYNIANEPHLLAGYTCTPLVKFPIDELDSGEKVRGVTLAELGNHNRPLDMFVYQKDGRDYILMSNSARGVMKISTDGIEREHGLAEKVSDTAGQTYETIESLQGVEQLAQLDSSHAAVLAKAGDQINLKIIDLP